MSDATYTHHRTHPRNFTHPYYRQRAEKMDELSRQGWTPQEIARRWDLGLHSVNEILKEWRKWEAK